MKYISLFSAFLAISAGEDCVFDKDVDFSTYPPLIMDKDAWISVLPVLEGSVRAVRIVEGAEVVLACPETTIMATATDVAEAVCNGGNVLSVGGQDYSMSELGCESRLKEAISKNVATCSNGEEHSIGFDVTGHDFYELVRVCFDDVLQSSLSTKHTLRGSSINASDTGGSRPSFKVDTGFYTVSANTCYEIASQETLMLQLLGDPDVIDQSSSFYFARGHLSPDGDFMTDMEAYATYYYINAIPQWQVINNGNWKALENAVRDLASNHDEDFLVYNGPLDILELNDVNSNAVEIYLGLTEGETVIPASTYAWKVVYEPATNRGVAVLMSNNPYLLTKPESICTDICPSISWIEFDVDDIHDGVAYCCTVQEFSDVVPNAPIFGSDVGILAN